MNAGESRTRRAYWLLLLTATIWASNYPLAKYAISVMDVFVFNSLRYILAGVVLGVLLRVREGWKPLHTEDRRRVLRVGIFASVLYQCAFIIGLNMTTAGNTAVLQSTSPLWTLFINSRMHREPIHATMWIGMILSLAGIVLIIIGSGKRVEVAAGEISGILIALTAALMWAFNTNFQKPLLAKYSPLHIATMAVAVGAVGLTLIAIPALLRTDWSSLHFSHYVATFASGALSIGLGNVFWSYGVQNLGPSRTSNFSNLIPVITIIISYFTLGEELHHVQFFGIAITVAGVWLARR